MRGFFWSSAVLCVGVSTISFGQSLLRTAPTSGGLTPVRPSQLAPSALTPSGSSANSNAPAQPALAPGAELNRYDATQQNGVAAERSATEALAPESVNEVTTEGNEALQNAEASLLDASQANPAAEQAINAQVAEATETWICAPCKANFAKTLSEAARIGELTGKSKDAGFNLAKALGEKLESVRKACPAVRAALPAAI